MDVKQSLLRSNLVTISNDITITIPTVGEILDDENFYYGIVNQIVASPYSMMVQLDDMGINFTTVSSYDLFLMYAHTIFSNDLSIIFGSTFSKLYTFLSSTEVTKEERNNSLVIVRKNDNDAVCLYDVIDDILIDEYIYNKIADTLRMINLFEKDKRKAGNDAAREYLIKKNRRYQSRHKNDKYKPFLENLVIALVNKQEFKYNYEETMDLSIYKFNRSIKQIKHTVNFDKTMIGVYAGTVDTSKIIDKSIFSFIET